MAEYAKGDIASAIGSISKSGVIQPQDDTGKNLCAFFQQSQAHYGKVDVIVDEEAVMRKEPQDELPNEYMEPLPVKKKKKPKHSKKVEPLVTVDGPSVLAQETKDVKKKKKTKQLAKPDTIVPESKVQDEPESEEPTIESKDVPEKTQDDVDKSDCTIFVGNISLETSAAQLKKYFKEHCETPIKSIRFRSVPTVGCAVNEHGNQKLVKKVCVNQKQFIEQRDNCNAYIVFASPEGVSQALTLNGKSFMDKFLRIDREHASLDAKHSVFVGNIPYDAIEDQLWTHFGEACENGVSDIANVRIIRDPGTGLGKGFGYVLFNDLAGVAQALTLDDKILSGTKRKLRVSICGKRFKNKDKVEKAKEQTKFNGRKTAFGAARRVGAKAPVKKSYSKTWTPTSASSSGKKKPNPTLTKKRTLDSSKAPRAETPMKKKKPKHAARKAAQAAAAAAN